MPLLIATGWRRSAADVNMMALYMNALFSPGFNPRMMACQHRRHQAGRVTRATGSGGRPSLAVDHLPPCVMTHEYTLCLVPFYGLKSSTWLSHSEPRAKAAKALTWKTSRKAAPVSACSIAALRTSPSTETQ